MSNGTAGQLRIASRKRFAGWTQAELSRRGMWMHRRKGQKHSVETQRATGHFHFMRLARNYTRKLGRKLTPAELAWVRATHKDEIAAACKGERWVKKPRVTPPGTWDNHLKDR